ncbi:PD-(D/E)XK nuclease family protein [Candidatus Coxiella mudrowiae]|uniref:ATP-dependent nuclease subunit B n=1 Tax=Candidatus Coxiella mudrowiae TaxID=2054173 RepID=A0ABM5UUE8_9COXI|nr:PD-(D/E)XK nuclease family protein [Candidatus Coxiella mudrowiae]AKQ33609.1 ATP-dependent nuclease subunit B [Candidatus Coxiella mudrowiae]
MYCELFPTLDKDIVVLTANRRLSYYLQEQYAHYQIKVGKKAWLRPTILPLNTWLSHCWQHCESTQGFLLSDVQEEVLWQKILGLSPQTANLAKKAWQLIKGWNLSLKDLEPEANSEVQCFIQWAYQFETELEKQKLINAVELPKQLEGLIPHLNLPQKIILLGFDELIPTIQQFLNGLAEKTIISCYLSRPHPKNYIHRLSFKEREAEIQTMARWAYNEWQKNSSKRIGCVIPALTEHRSQICRLFQNVFGSDKNFNISAGEPLAHLPLVKTALNILALNPFHIEVMELGTLFCSPYVNSMGDNSYLAAMLDVKLRETKQWQTNSTSILYHLDELQKKFPAATLKIRYQQWLSLERPPGTLFPSEWIEHFKKELSALGWPGQRSLDSKEYQQLERWKEMLQEFVEFDSLIPPQTRKQAFQLLWQLASKTLFQPQSAQNASIQILGLLEATGLEFDSLWIMGLDNKNWPSPPKPNPFLPIGLQRRHQMPHSSFKRESDYALQLQQRLINSASEVILSVSLQDQEVQLSPSPLILDFPQVNIEELRLPFFETLSENLFKSKHIEKIEDNQAPPLQEGEFIKGGSRILQSQSACPFQAFAEIRLRAKPLEQPQIGLSGANRGNFVHHALDVLWKKIKNWQNLINYSDIELETLIDETINELSFSFGSDSLFFRVEKKRIKHLIKRWLLLEKNRPPFNVSQQETDRFIKIGPLNLHVRIDRIDKVKGGNFIIDYKTNDKNQVTDWLGNRLKNVQLPLYCTFAARDVVGIAYAEVSSKKISFKGWLVSEEKPFNNMGSAPLPWKSLLDHWKTILHQLAIDFSLGKAEVNPFDIKTTCKFCGLHPLCRVGEEE